MQVRQHPVIPFTLFFLSGIFAQEVLRSDSLFWLIWMGITLVSVLAMLKRYRHNHELMLLLVLISGFLLGGLRQSWHTDASPLLLQKDLIRQAEVTGRIHSVNLDHNKAIRFVLLADSVRTGSRWHHFPQKVLCSVYDSLSWRRERLFRITVPGNSVRITGSLKVINSVRNPGSFDFRGYYARKEISYQIHPTTLRVTERGETSISSFLFSVRKGIAARLDDLHTPATSAILKALLLDEEGDIEKDTKENFINSGTAHTLAVSGSNVAAVVFILFFLFSRFPLRLRVLLTITGVFFFLSLTGSPPVERAVITAVIALLAIGTGRSTDAFAILLLSALIICLLNPQQLFDVGFQLSYSAVAGIIFANRWAGSYMDQKGIESKTARIVITFLAISIAAQLITMPLTAFYFGKISLISLPAGILVIPLTAGLFTNGILTLAISAVSGDAALYWAAGSELMNQFTGELVRFFATTGFSFLYSYQFSLMDLLVWYSVPVTGILFYRFFRGGFAGGFVLGMIPVLLLFYGSFLKTDLMPHEKLSVLFADVGQGDAALMKMPDGKTMLIDAGRCNEYYDAGQRILVPLMQYLRIDTIDYGFISHIDEDHYGGFLYLAEKGLIRHIFKPFEPGDPEDSVLNAALQATGVLVSPIRDTSFQLGGVAFYVLNDPGDARFSSWQDNDRSVVMKVVHGSNSFLFTGDAGRKLQEYLSNGYKAFLSSTVLKVPHHGGKGSLLQDFLDLTDPEIALISAGAGNPYGHPLPETIKQLNNAGIRILRTDKQGAVLILSDQNSYTFQTQE